MRLPTGVQRQLFELYDTIDRSIDLLRRHRERIHFEDVGNVHIVIDPDDLDEEPATTISEDDLPPELGQRLSDLRRMRRAMKGVNRSILRLIVSISSEKMIEEFESQSFSERKQVPGASTDSDHPSEMDIEKIHNTLRDIENQSFWTKLL